ncbi:MAG: FAD-binding protein [Proteobacteria bacterium]|nr:FAD-binding protein [Pseudomonadota bacterium]
MGKTLQIHSTLACDVLIIGAGGAGLRCAAFIHERRPDLKVFAVTKVAHPQKSHTGTAQGGLAAVDPKDRTDSALFHMFDTWKGGDCSSDQNVVRKIVAGGWEEVQWLELRGMHLSRDEEGNISKRQFGGHTVEFGKGDALRAVFEADRTGKGIMDTVWGEALKGGALFINATVATELLFNEGRCVGAVLFKVKEGEFVAALAGATVLATGGSGQVYRITTNCRNNTGDGPAVILRAGLPVMDPEAVQFHPTGIVGPGILASEALRSEGGILRNKDLEPFMERYAPKMKNLAPRDIVARSIEMEIREGRGIMNPDHQLEHVWIDLRHLPDHVHEVKLKEVASFFKTYANLDSRTQLCPVRPSNHYHMGGIPTNEYGEVQKSADAIVPGLFAIGECACASLHGFNRLGTNSLLELLVMGRCAGERVLSFLKENRAPAVKDAGEATLALFARYLEAQGKENVGLIRQEMRAMMTGKVGVFRDETGLQEAVASLADLKRRAAQAPVAVKDMRMNQELLERWELDNLLDNAMTIAQGALMRKESRGAHFREDYPERSDEYQFHTLVSMTDFGKVCFGKRPIDMSIHESGGEHAERFGIMPRKY